MNHAVLTRGLRLGPALIVLAVSVAPAARAQEGGGPPSQETVAQLYQTLHVFQSFNRTRAMFGLPPLEGEAAVQLRLLQADFDENIMPGLMFAEQDCFFAEVPLGKALNWLRTVQLLGLDEDWGPLWEEAAVIQDSLHTILVNCHKELYEKCLLDDGHPDAALLASVTRSLSLLDGDPIYDERMRRCAIGGTGYLKINETLHGNMTQSTSFGGASQSTRLVVSVTREFHIDLLNKAR